MWNAHTAGLAAAIAIVMAAGTASAAKKCNIVGSFTDSLGSTGQFTTERKGTVTNTNVCPSAYALTVTKLTESVIDVRGRAKHCGNLTGDFTFNNGGCTSASGTITIKGFGTFNDTITRSGNVRSRPGADASALTGGIK